MANRIYEHELDELFVRAFHRNPEFSAGFAKLAGEQNLKSVLSVSRQTRHVKHAGTIDIEVRYSKNQRMLIENKIDAGYSSTQEGIGQPERYQASVCAYRAYGEQAKSILLAPQSYLAATRSSNKFSCCIGYESLLAFFCNDELMLLKAAIAQAEIPYEPVRNEQTSNFFEAYREFVESEFPALVMKHNPNSNGTRPKESRTIYFDVSKTLQRQFFLPTPRMSIQCWDSKKPSASAKIMIGGWGKMANAITGLAGLADIGAYLRPAGKSLGIVIDTPRLDTNLAFNDQIEQVAEGLQAAVRLQNWWGTNASYLEKWA